MNAISIGGTLSRGIRNLAAMTCRDKKANQKQIDEGKAELKSEGVPTQFCDTHIDAIAVVLELLGITPAELYAENKTENKENDDE